MKFNYIISQRQSGKTTKLANEFSKDPKNTLILVMNTQMGHHILELIGREYKKNIITPQQISHISGIARFKKLLVDEWDYINKIEEVYNNIVLRLTPDAEIIAYTTPKKTYRISNLVIAKMIHRLGIQITKLPELLILDKENFIEVKELLAHIVSHPNVKLTDQSLDLPFIGDIRKVNNIMDNGRYYPELSGKMFI